MEESFSKDDKVFRRRVVLAVSAVYANVSTFIMHNDAVIIMLYFSLGYLRIIASYSALSDYLAAFMWR